METEINLRCCRSENFGSARICDKRDARCKPHCKEGNHPQFQFVAFGIMEAYDRPDQENGGDCNRDDVDGHSNGTLAISHNARSLRLTAPKPWYLSQDAIRTVSGWRTLK